MDFKSLPAFLTWKKDQTTVFLRVLDFNLAGQSSLGALWFWDLEATTTMIRDTFLADNTVTLIDLNAYSVRLGDKFTKVLDVLADSSVPIDGTETDYGTTILRLVFSKASGYIARSDFLNYRLHGANFNYTVVSFLEPLSVVPGTNPNCATAKLPAAGFVDLFGKSIGGVVARKKSKTHGVNHLQRHLDDEFSKRLSGLWIVKQTPTQSRVFWVQGRADIESSRQFYEAARALDITLVVLDQPGHWLEDDSGQHAHYREAFIPMSVDGDEGLTQRVVEAVKAYPHKVDGIVTISDVRLPLIARACEILGLPTSSSAAYLLAGDKGATRELENVASLTQESFVVNEPAELEKILVEEGASLQFPLIVKPCSGWNSDCVTKVRTRDELRSAVHRASARHALSPNRSTKVVVEPYIDGPEVDVNFIILDGKVLFCDISDDFPSSGDRPDDEISATSANFMETLMDVPTSLPSNEQEVLKAGLTASISRLGFQSGIFHCEARVRNSRAHYQRSANGIVDMYVSDRLETLEAPSCYLHEVNARPPGYVNCVAALLAYGIDYYAIRLLLSIGPRENERVKILAQPFLHSKPQYVLGVVVLPPTRAGIMASNDAVEDFLVAYPDLQKHVVHHQTIIKKGDRVLGPESSELWCVGYITVGSRKGRQECLELVQQIREKFDYKLEGQ
ncbi:uncharacterized protein EKO05_0009508 [Ascochyta rabiei]|uniref:uncharacterized protein n=1 Tax=Didymella rabiei TaxID=5454 RepID=UPI0021F9970F|nr:uncharacterized protein EKO05_0009508 [Ascochyta rabiei]UPX19239.1 hypothetical protein EKO05_0009508 [Ascochyta rabiei]